MLADFVLRSEYFKILKFNKGLLMKEATRAKLHVDIDCIELNDPVLWESLLLRFSQSLSITPSNFLPKHHKLVEEYVQSLGGKVGKSVELAYAELKPIHKDIEDVLAEQLEYLSSIGSYFSRYVAQWLLLARVNSHIYGAVFFFQKIGSDMLQLQMERKADRRNQKRMVKLMSETGMFQGIGKSFIALLAERVDPKLKQRLPSLNNILVPEVLDLAEQEEIKTVLVNPLPMQRKLLQQYGFKEAEEQIPPIGKCIRGLYDGCVTLYHGKKPTDEVEIMIFF